MKRIIIICVLLLLSVDTVYANSAQTRFYGSDGFTIVQLEESPIVVEKEELTFHLNSFPTPYEDNTTYDGRVEAAYYLYNPSDLKIHATFYFPMGVIPSYYDYIEENPYAIYLDDQVIDYKFRHTFSYQGDSFDVDKDLNKIVSGYRDHDFYHPDQTVYRYHYRAKDYGDALDVAFGLEEEMDARFILQNVSSAHLIDDCHYVGTWLEDEIVLNVINKPYEVDWKFYSSASLKEEVAGTMVLEKVEEMSLLEFVLLNYDENSDVSKEDYYNAMIDAYDQFYWDAGILLEVPLGLDGHLLKWYEYELDIEANSRTCHRVIAPIYPTIDYKYEPEIYEYTYLLSPAKRFKTFETLEISIISDYYLIDSNMSFEDKKASFDYLPEDELTFTLASSEKVQAPQRFNLFSIVSKLFNTFIKSLFGGSS